MPFHLALSYTATIVGIAVAIVYKKSNFSILFLLFAVSDILSFMLWKFFSLSSQTLWIPMHYLIVMSVNKSFLLKHRYYIIAGLVPFIILSYFSTIELQHLFVFITELLLLLIFLRYFLISYFSYEYFNMFYLFMVFHEAVIIIKFLALFKDIGFGLNVFFAGVAIQIIIGIILLFLRKEADKFNFGKEN